MIRRSYFLACLIGIIVISAFAFAGSPTRVAATSGSPSSWNPLVPCNPLVVRVTDITANQTGLSSFGTSPFSPGITTTVTRGEAKRWLTPGSTPPGWVSPGPACTVTNSKGTTSLFVQINGVERTDLSMEDYAAVFDPTNGGSLHANRSDTTFSLFDPSIVPQFLTSCTSPSDSTCYGRIHAEIDHDWKVAGYCGTGTLCDDAALASQTAPSSTLIDVQGFVFWDDDNLNASWHQFSGWEIHPLTGWRISKTPIVSIDSSPPNPQVGEPVSFSATVSGGSLPSAYNWDFGDGVKASGSSVSHIYLAAQAFTVHVTAVDGEGLTGTAQKVITVGSWNPAVGCVPVSTTLEGVTGNVAIQRVATDPNSMGADYSGGGFRLAGNLPYGSNPAIWPFFKRDLQLPCSVDGTPAIVEFHNVTVTDRNVEECSTTYSIDNGGRSYPNGWQSCDTTFNLVTPGYGDTSTCPECYMHRVFAEIDRDWNASGIAPPIAPSDGQRIDVQGFVYWSNDNTNATWHSYSGWEIHPLTAWRPTRPPITVSVSFSPSNPAMGENVTFTGAASDGTAPYGFIWDFGDGTVTTGNPVSHAYGSGTYSVHLAATDSLGTVGVFSQTVTVTDTPGFSLSEPPASLIVQAGNTNTSMILLASINGFSGNISLSSSVTPTGPTASLSPTTIALAPNSPGNVILTVSAGPTTLTGSYNVVVTASGETLQKTLQVAVTVVGPPDFTPPVIASSISPTPNDNGWDNAVVEVSWSVSDPESGIAGFSGCGTTILTTETAGTTITCSATNGAGLSSSVSVTIKIDLTPPVITSSRSPGPNANGWNNSPVKVGFSCTDSLSGVGSLSSPSTLSSEAAGQSITGSCTDRARNSVSRTIGSINIDLTPPVVTGSRTPTANANGWNNGDVTVTFTCTDNLSGVDVTPLSSQTVSTEGLGQSRTGTCTDKAGNFALTIITGINIDKTQPTIAGSDFPAANSNGWNNGTVTVTFVCTDSLSGVASEPVSPQVVSSEGQGQSRTATCQDKAGNSASATVSGISVDMTPPTVSGSTSPGPNANGWNNADVTVSFACIDSLSGVASSSAPVVLTGEGVGQSVEGSCSDLAGNSASITIGNVNIDKTWPSIVGSSSPGSGPNGWNNSPVTFSFECTDSLSGVGSVSSPTVLDSEGANQSVAGVCTDKAGNSASTAVTGINIDLTSPGVTGIASPSPNAYGWNNDSVTVTFTCVDTLSGVDVQPVSPQIITKEGASQTSTASCTDKAGNSASTTVIINIDKTAPNITGSRSPDPNDNGWNNSPVTVILTCTDLLSGVASPPASPQTVSTEGAGQFRSGTCTDKAGNSASAILSGINVDLTSPTITSSRSIPPNEFGWNNRTVTISFDCTDSLSGVGSFSSPVTLNEGAGQSAKGTCADEAGNLALTTLGAINIDTTPPTISSSVLPKPNANGWNNSPVTVSFSCSDFLSGVETSTADSTVSTEVEMLTVTGSCVDSAGNMVTTTAGPVSIDLTVPAITGSKSPAPNGFGWNKEPVTVHFDCHDPVSNGISSGVDALTNDQIVASEGANQSQPGICIDKAGNSASTTIGAVNIDLAPPTFNTSTFPPLNPNSWTNVTVTVSFDCIDLLSGVDTFSAPTTLGEGAGQSVTGTCTDRAGNYAITTYGDINIDMTQPTITAAKSPGPNTNGWNNGPVTVSFDCTDSLSGVRSVTGPVALDSNGIDQVVMGNCTDRAGNSVSTTASGINIDLSPPTITGLRTPGPNVNNWNNVPLTVSFECDDALSGIATCSSPSILNGEGARQSVTGTATDLAGNSASFTVDNINIDTTPPTISGSVSPGPNSKGWNNSPVTVSFSCSDGISGVDSNTSNSTISTEVSMLTVTGSCTDRAGNPASTMVGPISIDLTPPVIRSSRSPIANGFGWNNGSVTVHFDCSDPVSDGVESGIASVTSDQVISTEGQGQSGSGTCADSAGNTSSSLVSDINIDFTSPIITGSRSPSPNGNGWNNSPVTVTFDCADSLSTVNTFSSPTILGEGGGQSVVGTCTDKAGNTASSTVRGINIDTTSPTITASASPSPNFYGWNNQSVTVTFTCSDGLSGIEIQPVSPQTITTEGDNQSRGASCTDKAGNSASITLGGINIDLTSPIVGSSRSLQPNSFGWNNVPVIVSFVCTDSLSRVGSVSSPVTLFEGEGQSVTGNCTDSAGNSASITDTNVNVDLTPPIISGSPSLGPNLFGWNNADLTVSFGCSDALSGVASCSPPVTLTVEGENQSVTGTVMDVAGNSAQFTVNSINIDKTSPTIIASRSPSPNDNGWNNVDVTVGFSCTDSLSGVNTFSRPVILSADGAGQSASGDCTDLAGNSVSTTLSGISIDRTLPTLSGTVSPEPNSNGWNNGPVTVGFACSDSFSGVDSKTANSTLNTEVAMLTVKGSCTDRAGNTAFTTTAPISIDLTQPSIVGSKSPSPNSFGWDLGPVIVHFDCSDRVSNNVSSGVDTVTSDQAVATEGTAQSRTGTCLDKAGNSASATVGDINIDLTPPSIAASRSVPPNADGWNNVPVTVSFSCNDSLSEVDGFSSPITLQEGRGQSATGTCTDKAGNSVSLAEKNINIDLTSPTISGAPSPGPNGNGWNNSPVTVSFTCTDALSSVESVTVPVILVTNGAGLSATGACIDKAGNSVSTTISDINIDQTPPNITGSASPAPNLNVWNNGPVTVSFTCTDALSGVDTGPVSPQIISTDGLAQSRVGSCTDMAGNSASETVSGINIDQTPPTISGSKSPAPNTNDWNNGTVTVTFTCTDSLSGVNVGPLTPQLVSTEAASQSRTATCQDEASNSASATVSDINIDLTPPTITGTFSPDPNANGWNNVSVTVSFNCEDALSGLASCSPPTILADDGPGQSAKGFTTDLAGNSASFTVSNINVDKTAPSIFDSVSPGPNGNGWNNGPVTISFYCSDSLSGVDSGTGNSTITTEVSLPTVTGSCTDKAGNSVSTAAGPVNIDLSPPTITSSKSPLPNAFDWNNGPVTVHYDCSDPVSNSVSSGVDAVISDQTVTAQGAGQSRSGNCFDKAGNSASTTLGDINIDLTAPTITSSRSGPPNRLGWNNVSITVSFACSDSLSGVSSISPPVVLNEGGAQSATGTCADLAGNTASVSETNIKVDLTPPVITGNQSPAPNSNAWNNDGVTVSFVCSDSLSGISAQPTSPEVVTTEGFNQAMNATCTDNAGNSASFTMSGISIDKTPPAISGSRSPEPNANGWNNSPVTVSFTCNDSLSGVASAPPSTQTLSTLGEGQSVTGTCTDQAGNSASTTFIVNIDETAPSWPTGSVLTTINVTPTSLTLSWIHATDNVQIAGYQVFRGDTLIATLPGNVTSHTVTDLSPGTTYDFKVQTVDLAGNVSPESLSGSETMPAQPQSSQDPSLTIIATLGDIGVAAALLIVILRYKRKRSQSSGADQETEQPAP